MAQPLSLSVKQVLTQLETNLPLLRSFKETLKAKQYNIDLARNSLMPDLTIGYQAGSATYNNIIGMNYPGLIMPITGPAGTGNSYNLVPETALAGLLKWNPITFGQRTAAIEKANSQVKLANANYNDQLFRQQYQAISIYLNILYLKKVLFILDWNIERSRTELEQSFILARKGLRPGIDTTQFQSGLVKAEIEFFNTEKLYAAQKIELSRLIGLNLPIEQFNLTDTSFANQLPIVPDTSRSFTSNPTYQLYQSEKELGAASLKEIDKSWMPKLDVWANAFARGSGVEYNGLINKADGWSLSRNNYGIGVQLSFPVLQFARMNIQKKQYSSQLQSDEALLAQASIDISKQIETADFNLHQDIHIAELEPLQLKAAADAYYGLQISYGAGLIDYTRLAESQYAFQQAELDRIRAYIQAWRSLLELAIAKGDLNILLDQLK
jgi:outer membrane protein